MPTHAHFPAEIFGDIGIIAYLCTISEGNDGMLMFLIMRNGGGFHRSFLAAAVGYAIRFVFCSSTVAVLFFCSLSLVVSELFCNFAASKAFPLLTPAPSSVSAFAILLLSGRAFFAKSLAVSKFCCTFAPDKGSDFADVPAISAE